MYDHRNAPPARRRRGFADAPDDIMAIPRPENRDRQGVRYPNARPSTPLTDRYLDAALFVADAAIPLE